MSDFTIPGVTSKYNSNKIVDDLMKIERIPLKRMENSIDDLKDEKKIWQNLNKNISDFSESSKRLYNYENPFLSKIVESSDEEILSASAARDADIQTQKIKVKKIAKPDKFLSKSIDKNYKVPAGNYKFKIGEKEIIIKYKGGKIDNFLKAINKKSKANLKASLINDTSESKVFLLEATKTGKNNKIEFLEDSKDLALDIGLIKKHENIDINFDFETSSIEKWEKNLNENIYEILNDKLNIKSTGELSLPLKKEIEINDGIKLELNYSINKKDAVEKKDNIEKPGPIIPEIGDVNFQGITIKNNISKTVIPKEKIEKPLEIIENNNIFYLDDGNNLIKLPEIKNTGENLKLELNLSEYAKSIKSLKIRNENTYKDITINSIRIYDTESRGDYIPVNQVSTASNSIIEYEGIEIERDKKEIKDLIPGLTINLNKESEDYIELNVTPDKEAIKDSLISFIGNYNKLLGEIQILSRGGDDILNELQYLTEDEKDSARERLGTFQGDLSLMQMRGRFQRIMMDSYSNPIDPDMNLLANIGISTNSAKSGGSPGIDNSKLRGYLEINEKKLDKLIEKNVDGIKALFGHDSDGDLVIDKGIAFFTNEYAKPYFKSGGIISAKIDSIDNKITKTDRDIENYNVKLSRKEDDLKRKYGIMEGTLNSLEKSSQSIQNLNKSN